MSSDQMHHEQSGGRAAARKANKDGVVFYTVVEGSGEQGRYSSKSGPAAAAKKAASRRFKSGQTSMSITLRQLGTDRTFSYTAKRTKLAKPFSSKIAGKTIVREWEVSVVAKK